MTTAYFDVNTCTGREEQSTVCRIMLEKLRVALVQFVDLKAMVSPGWRCGVNGTLIMA